MCSCQVTVYNNSYNFVIRLLFRKMIISQLELGLPVTKRAKTIELPVVTMATKNVVAFQSGCFLAAHE